jgi:hypothetical protein
VSAVVFRANASRSWDPACPLARHCGGARRSGKNRSTWVADFSSRFSAGSSHSRDFGVSQAVREGVRIPLLPAIFLGLVAVCSGADHSLVNARRAQALLGPEVWSEVIRIENSAQSSHYPRSLHALVFELAGILWFYTEVDGTQSFSLHHGRLAAEKANYAPLLRDIEPGFTRWTAVGADVAAGSSLPPEAPLPNGCFIESYAALRMLVARGVPVREPKLLSYYGHGKVRREGHTVLTYAADRGVTVVDPVWPERPSHFPADVAANPIRLARAVQGPEVQQARLLPLPLPEDSARRDVFAASQSVSAETGVY